LPGMRPAVLGMALMTAPAKDLCPKSPDADKFQFHRRPRFG